MLDATAEDELDDVLALFAVGGRSLDGLVPLRLIGERQVAQLRRVREPLEVRHDLLRMPVDHADRLEHSVAALRAQLPHAQRRCGRIDEGERVCEVGAGDVGRRRIDHQSKAPCHDPSLGPREYLQRELVTLEWPGRITPGSNFCRCERPSAERRFCGPVFSCPGTAPDENPAAASIQANAPERHSTAAADRSCA